MQTNNIEQAIDDIFDFIESCKRSTFSSTKVIVPKEELYDMLDELQRTIPGEIEKLRKMLNQKEQILNDAENKANDILTDAREQYNAMVEEHAIMQEAKRQAEATVQEAQAQAQEIIENAEAQAFEIQNGAIYYTRDMLEMAEKTMAMALQSASNNARALEVAMQGHLDIIRKNKSELMGMEEPEEEPAEEQEVQEVPEKGETGADTAEKK